jgi:hypothetical protein
MILALLLALLAGASGEIEFEVSVDASVNETVFMGRVDALAQIGRALNTTNVTNGTLSYFVLSKASFNVTRVVTVLCIEGVGCFNDLPPPDPTPSEGANTVLIGLLCGVGVLCLGIVVLLIVSLRKPPPKKTVGLRLPPRNRGWTMG